LLRLLERRTGLVLSMRGVAQLETTFVGLLRRESQQVGQHVDQSGLELLEHLRKKPQALEWEALLEAATIPETHFYRVAPQMLALEREILPELLLRPTQQNHVSRSLRIWSAGCSSGEEAYTLAFLLEEATARLGIVHQANSARVLGTDLSPQALKLAQRARYGEWSFRGTPAYWREKYFVPLEPEHSRVAQWEVLERYKGRVEFGVYNLVEPPKAQELSCDLIVCRNVTLYFRPEVAQAVYRHLTSRLSAGGYLLLGPSDPPPLPSSELEQKSAPGAFYWQKVPGAPRKTQAPLEFPPVLPFQPSLSRGMPTPKQISPPINTPVNPLLEPDSTLLERGLEQLERGEAAAALELLRKSAYADPSSAFTHFLLAQTWLALNRPVRARAALLHAQNLLSSTPPDTPLASAPDLSALDLRHALERLLLTLDAPNSR